MITDNVTPVSIPVIFLLKKMLTLNRNRSSENENTEQD